MVEADANEYMDRMRWLLRSSEKIGVVLQVREYVDSSTGSHYPSELCSRCMASCEIEEVAPQESSHCAAPSTSAASLGEASWLTKTG